MVHESQNDVFQPSPSLDSHNEQGRTAIAPNNAPLSQTEEKEDQDRKGGVGQAAAGPPPPPLVPNPPNLEAWRQKLFDVNEMITLSEEECVFLLHSPPPISYAPALPSALNHN